MDPEHPFLYGVKYQVMKNGKIIDEVLSYAGMRKVHLANGYFYLNNKPYYQRLVLDQGYYPDGIWTAPTDAALKKDIEMSKAWASMVPVCTKRVLKSVTTIGLISWATSLGAKVPAGDSI